MDPSKEYLRRNESLQNEVESRSKNLIEALTKGSQGVGLEVPLGDNGKNISRLAPVFYFDQDLAMMI